MRRLALLAVLGGALAGTPLSADRYDDLVPEKPQRYVTDRAGVFGSGQAEDLNSRLEQFERDTTNQILVWVDSKIPEGFTLEDFTVRAAQKWGAGRKETDNGAILFVFTEDRKIRMEVGYGLEGALPDVTAKRIIEDEIVPRFRNGDYPAGILAGAGAMMAAVKGEYRGSGRTVDEEKRGRRNSIGGCLPFLFFFGIFILFPMLFRRRRLFRSHGGGGWWTGADSGAAGGAAAVSAAGEGAFPGAGAPSAEAEPPEAGRGP